MKILFLNYEYPPLGGGTGIANYYLLKEFSKIKTLQVDTLTSSINKYKEEEFSNNIKVIKLNIGKKNKQIHHQTGLNLISFFIKSTVFALKNRHNYNLIHAFSGLPGGVTALLLNKPYIVSLRGGDQPGYEERFDKLLKFVRPLLKLIYTKAQSVDANSKYLKQLTLRSFPKLNIKVIRNGVDLKKFYPAKKLPKKPIILCNSRLGKRKGIEYLIKAMPKVIAKIPQARLILVGEGVEKENLKRLTSELRLDKQVKFLGKVEHKKLPEIYRKASVFVLPSLSESLSNSLLEALACGLPVVATNVGGNPELVKKNNGLLVPTANEKALAQAIVKLLSKPTGKGNTGLISWKKTAKEYFQLYSEKSLS
ncbi:glycosyltransferase [Patescibacteria group bacterium]